MLEQDNERTLNQPYAIDKVDKSFILDMIIWTVDCVYKNIDSD